MDPITRAAHKLELELIQSHMTQKPVPRGEVAHPLRPAASAFVSYGIAFVRVRARVRNRSPVEGKGMRSQFFFRSPTPTPALRDTNTTPMRAVVAAHATAAVASTPEGGTTAGIETTEGHVAALHSL